MLPSSSRSDAARALIARARSLGRTALDEPTGKRILAMYGLAVPCARQVDPAGIESLGDTVECIVGAMTPPFVLKIVSPDVPHKSDVGGVALGLEDAAAILAGMSTMAATAGAAGHRIDGYLVEETAPAGHDLVIGGFRDPSFGQIVMVGLGGIFVELLRDVAFRICPITRIDALEMLAELKGADVLKGARGGLVASESALVDALLAVAGEDGLLVDLGREFSAIDVNPLIVSADGAVAVDARFILSDVVEGLDRPAEVRAPFPDGYRALFEPKTIAVLGVSRHSVGQGNTFIGSLRAAGYQGAIYPIHPTEATLEGLTAYPSLGQTPQPVDYAFVAIPAGRVPGALRAGSGRVRFTQVMSSGFGPDDGGPGSARALLDAATAAGIRLLGPNCMGTYSPRGRMSFIDVGEPEAGAVGILSQSGGLTIDILRRGTFRGLRFSGVVSLGNCLDIGPNELLEHFLADPGTRVIGAYVEQIRDGQRFFRQLRKAGAVKPVVLLKGGRSTQGQRAAASHTGSLASNDRVWDALAKQTGSILVDDLAQFVDTLVALQSIAPSDTPPSNRVVLFGNGGGASVLAADALARQGLDVAPLNAQTTAALAGLGLPAGASLDNPIDVPANLLQRESGGLARRILSILGTVEVPRAIIMHLNLPVILGYSHVDMLGDLLDAALQVRESVLDESTHLLLVLRSSGQPVYEGRRRACAERAMRAGIPVFDDLPEAGRALAALLGLSSFRYRRGRPAFGVVR